MSLSLRKLMLEKDAQSVLSELDIGRSATLDKLAALACEITDHDAGLIALMDETTITPVGLSNCALSPVPRKGAIPPILRRSQYFPDFGEDFPTSPLANGRVARFESGCFCRLHLEGEVIGFLAVMSRAAGRRPADSALSSLTDIADISSALIRSKAELKLTLGNVFALANR